MRVLLDEMLSSELRHYLPGHEVRTAQYMGWRGKTNGELLRLARDEFDVLITLDRHIPSQQNITKLDVGIMVLISRSKDIGDLRRLVPGILNRLLLIERGDVVFVEAARPSEA